VATGALQLRTTARPFPAACIAMVSVFVTIVDDRIVQVYLSLHVLVASILVVFVILKACSCLQQHVVFALAVITCCLRGLMDKASPSEGGD
jgi:hypothetical protein